MSLKMTTTATPSRPLTKKERFLLQSKSKWEKVWKQRKAEDVTFKEKQRELLCEHLFKELELKNGARILDLGCGSGRLLQRLFSSKFIFEGLDVSSLALNKVTNRHIYLHEGCLPFTKLEDKSYSVVFCTEMIGEFAPIYQRLLLSECARLLENEGTLIFSTRVDINSVDPIKELLYLLGTEFEISKTKHFHHSYHERLCRWFPWFENKKKLVSMLEWSCRKTKGYAGISEVFCVCKKKKLTRKKRAGDYLKAWN